MIKIFAVYLSLILHFTIYSQESNQNKFFFNEFFFNGNVSLSSQHKNFYGFGGGLGLIRVAFQQKQNNLIFGLEFNNFQLYSPIYKDNPKETLTNVNASIYSISIPVLIRHNFGKTKRLYGQLGTSFDLNLLSIGTGNYSTYGPNGGVTNDTKDITLDSRNTITPTLSIGHKTKLRGRYFFIQADYKYNLNPPIQGEMDGEFRGQYLRLNIGISTK